MHLTVPSPSSNPHVFERSAPVGLAVVGAGRWGARIIATAGGVAGCKLVCICDRDRERLLPYASGSAASLVTRYEDALDDPRVRAVAIATPSDTHAELAMLALSRGKDVFVEKPMATNLDDARAVLNAARDSGRQLLVGHVMRYHPGLTALRERVRSGALGSVFHFESQRLGRSSVGLESSAWWELAPHDISLVSAFFGDSPLWIRARRSEDGARIRAHLLFADGRTAALTVGASGGVRRRRVTLWGTRAVSRFDDHAPGASARTHAIAPRLRPVGGRTHRAPDHGHSAVLPLHAELDHFVEALRQGTPIRTDAAEGARVVAALDAGAQSLARDGAWIAVPKA